MTGEGISLLVPFTPDSAVRARVWDWLVQYWGAYLPGAEIVVGDDRLNSLDIGVPFSKTIAVNEAAGRATGDVFVILDADAYVAPDLIMLAAQEIRLARGTGRRLWFIPYRRFYRLSEDTTERVLASDPRDPEVFSDPPDPQSLEDANGQAVKFAHYYAAMVMAMPREAFEMAGGMDERFDGGWGGEDVSFMRCLDTVYSPHKTINRSVVHLWHPSIGAGIHRRWKGQTRAMPFTRLASRYQAAYGDRARMLRLSAEWRTTQETL